MKKILLALSLLAISTASFANKTNTRVYASLFPIGIGGEYTIVADNPMFEYGGGAMINYWPSSETSWGVKYSSNYLYAGPYATGRANFNNISKDFTLYIAGRVGVGVSIHSHEFADGLGNTYQETNTSFHPIVGGALGLEFQNGFSVEAGYPFINIGYKF